MVRLYSVSPCPWTAAYAVRATLANPALRTSHVAARFAAGPSGMSRDSQPSLDWLVWLVASAAVQRKVKPSFTHISPRLCIHPSLFFSFFFSHPDALTHPPHPSHSRSLPSPSRIGSACLLTWSGSLKLCVGGSALCVSHSAVYPSLCFSRPVLARLVGRFVFWLGRSRRRRADSQPPFRRRITTPLGPGVRACP